jgi:nicotinate phosphoribosyltransferase
VGTSNVMAGKAYGIPIVGTMAHSFISSFEHEIDAFRAYVRSFPHNAILLIDTYDTLQGARHAVQIAKEMATRGETLIGVRLDSGDLADLARQVRKIFDDASLPGVKIIGSGGLDEYDLAALAAAEAPFDSYGVGTRMGTSADAPWMDMAYKLVEYNRAPVLKLSTGKASSPGRKQIFRTCNGTGDFAQDTVGLRGETIGGERLLQHAMCNGRRTGRIPSLSDSRKLFTADFAALPEKFKSLRNPPHYHVDSSEKLRELREQTTAQYAIR